MIEYYGVRVKLYRFFEIFNSPINMSELEINPTETVEESAVVGDKFHRLTDKPFCVFESLSPVGQHITKIIQGLGVIRGNGQNFFECFD